LNYYLTFWQFRYIIQSKSETSQQGGEVLDFLLVLGRVPGMPFFITFNELVLIFLVWAGRYEYRLHRRFVKWAWYRICVNYRKQKRMTKTFIKVKRYRLAVWERRQIRLAKSYVHHQKMDAIKAVLRAKRQTENSIRRTYKQTLSQIDRRIRRTKRTIRMAFRRLYRATVVASYLSYRRTKRQTILKIRRTKRALVFKSYVLPKRKLRLAKIRARRTYKAVLLDIYRRYRRVYRNLARRQRRLEKAFKASRLGNIHAGISIGTRPSSRN